MTDDLKYCSRCLYSEDHPLGLFIGEDGLCSGCHVHEEKYTIDWDEKEAQFKKILDRYKNSGNSFFDCVIPVTGNSDSYFVVDTIKNKYGMNPLLVTYNTQFNTRVGIRNLARLLAEMDCDHLTQTVSPSIAKKATLIGLEKFGDIYWHVNAGSQTFPVQVATKFKIPLVIWGVNAWLDQVGMFSHHDNVEMAKKVRKEHSLRGWDAQELLSDIDGLSTQDIQPFVYPSDSQLEKSRVRGLYLGNFIKWDAQKQSEDMIKKFGYESSSEIRTFNSYETIYCWNKSGVHDYLKYLKCGYGKATDHATRDIRLKRMTREEGIELANQYDQVLPEESIDLFLDWIGMSRKQFFEIMNTHRNPKYWRKNKNGKFILKSSINYFADESLVEKNRLEANDPRNYIQTNLLEEKESQEEYILMGRTYLDEENFKAIEG